MATKSIKKKQKKDIKYKFLLDLICVVIVAVFAYTTAMIVVAYQMGVMWS
jgi:hypothetical protein